MYGPCHPSFGTKPYSTDVLNIAACVISRVSKFVQLADILSLPTDTLLIHCFVFFWYLIRLT